MLKKTPRTTGTGGRPNKLPPLTFHSVHGKEVRVFNDGSFASVVWGSDGYPGIAFSARPVKVEEKVCLRIKIPYIRCNSISFGFTNHDPATLAHPLPMDSYDLINKPGNWAKSQSLKNDNIFDYYVNSAGDVHFSINGEDRGLFLADVDTRNPLWALVLFNRGTIVQFRDPKPRAPNQVRRRNQSLFDKDILKAPRTTGTGGTPDNLPPLTFHSVHGENVRVSSDGSIAARKLWGWGYEHGLAFSGRPVKVNEKVCFRLVGTFYVNAYFGFTSHDPATLAHSLPMNAYDFINKPGNWAYIEDFRDDCIFDYYVNPAGDVHFSISINGERLLFTGVDTKKPLWAFVDVRDEAVQFVDPRAPNQVRRQNQSPVDENRLERSLSSLCVNEPLPPLRYTNLLVPLSLHRIKGRNVQFVNDRGVAARVDAEIGQGYVFTAQPMRPGQTIVVQILSTESGRDAGILSFGLTSCDPASLRPCDLPADAELLLDRSEYWVVQRDPANGLGRGDELAVTLTMDGEVTVSRNGSTPVTVMHVDHTVELWAFFDICGATQKVRMLTTEAVTSPPQQLGVLTGTAAPLAGAGGTVLVDSSPPQNNAQNAANHQQGLKLASTQFNKDNSDPSDPAAAASTLRDNGGRVPAAAFRRTVYIHNLWAIPLPDFTGRPRDCSPEFYRFNDSQMHRLVPWLNRELHYLLNGNIGQISYVIARILELLPQFHINSPEFGEVMQVYVRDRTEHFLHELYCFASTPYDLTGYDRNVQYTTDTRISTMVDEVISSSKSEASVNSDIVMVSSSAARSVAGSIARTGLLGATTSTQAPTFGNNTSTSVFGATTQNQPTQASSQPCLAGQQPADGNSTETECTICFDNPIDCALYACGHMCMCHTCAVQQWKGNGNGKCPQCRAEIRDVLRLYKS